MASKTNRQRPQPQDIGRPGVAGVWRRRKWWFIGGGVVGATALLVFLTQTLSGPDATGRVVPVPSSQSLSASPVSAGSSLPNFPLALYQGQDILSSSQPSFQDLLGKQPVVVNFWASNCPPCAAEIPEFEKVWRKYRDRVMFIGLDIGRFAGLGGPEDSKRELRQLGVTYPAAPVPDIQSVQALRVQGLPSTYFITPDGRISKMWVGTLNEAKLIELVEQLLTNQ